MLGRDITAFHLLYKKLGICSDSGDIRITNGSAGGRFYCYSVNNRTSASITLYESVFMAYSRYLLSTSVDVFENNCIIMYVPVFVNRKVKNIHIFSEYFSLLFSKLVIKGEI